MSTWGPVEVKPSGGCPTGKVSKALTGAEEQLSQDPGEGDAGLPGQGKDASSKKIGRRKLLYPAYPFPLSDPQLTNQGTCGHSFEFP